MNKFHRWFCRSDFWRRELEHKLLPWVLHGLDPDRNVLEVGPGPGLTTDLLRQRIARLTVLEIDPRLAAALRQRLHDTSVQVVEGDATRLPFADETFSGAVCFTMLHHVPSRQLQDQLLAEVFRVLKPGAVFAGSDSRWSRGLQLIHLGDTLVPVEPETFAARLESAGFTDVSIEVISRMFRFRARHP
ncbi:MAG: class I SAM-dependent methyltransferase [Blastocatellia bacterium]